MTGDAKARIEALDPSKSFCVTAPAGSGKTELLTQRILSLLARVDNPQQVLAITFTRKAAAEMRIRLLTKLEQARRNDPVDQPHEQVTRELAIGVLKRAELCNWKLGPGSFNLRTIDSLCADLTRQMPILSGLGGSAELTQHAQPLYEQAVEQLLDQTSSDDKTGRALRILLLHFDNDWSRLRMLLVALLHRRADWAGRLGMHYAPEAAEQALVATVTALCEAVLGRLRSALGSRAPRLLELLTHAQKRLGQNTAEVVSGSLEAWSADDVPVWQEAIALLVTKKSEWRKTWNKNQGFPPEDKTEKQEIADLVTSLSQEGAELLELFEECFRLPLVTDGDPSWELVLQLSHLLPILQAQLLLVFQRENRVDYTHIALAAEQALGEDDDPTDLALRFDYQLQHILVDEFQDTSDQQYRLLSRLTRGWADHNRAGHSPRTLFLVGDGMQSIYGFRYANVGIFLDARNRGLNGLELTPLELQSNFRSTDQLVSWVNRVFSKILPDQDDPSRGQVRHVRAEATRGTGAPSSVEVHVIEDVDGSAEASFVTGRILDIREQEPSATVAILVRARSHAYPVMESLEQAGIDYVARDFDPLKYRPVIRDLMTLCRWLVNPSDEVASAALLRAPWCGLTVDSIELLITHQPRPFSLRGSLQQAHAAREMEGEFQLKEQELARLTHLLQVLNWAVDHRDRMGLSVWIEQIWLRLGAHMVQDGKAQVDARCFFTLLAEAERSGVGLDLAWLQQELEVLYGHQAAEVVTVEIMTIHKAKGLQFDHVFLPMMQKSAGSQDRDLLRWHWLSDTQANGLLIAANDRRDPQEPSLYNYLNWLQRKKDAAELRRLIYVGVTRARNSVCMSAGHHPDKDWPAWPSSNTGLGVLREAVEGEVIFHPMLEQSPENEEDDDEVTGFYRLPLDSLLAINPSVKDDAEYFALSTGGSAANEGDRGGGQLDRDVLYQANNQIERLVGISCHRILEILSKRQVLPDAVDSNILGAIDLSLRSSGLEKQSLGTAREQVVAIINKTLADDKGRWILKNRPDSSSEMGVDVLTEEGLQSRIIDRVFRDEGTGMTWVVDYKTSRRPKGESVEDFLERESNHYREQVAAYVDLVGRLDEGAGDIRGALYFPAESLWRPLV